MKLDADILCPYYKSVAAKSVTCEWCRGDRIMRKFKSEERRTAYVKRFCCDAWNECPIAVFMTAYYEKREKPEKAE